MTWNFERIAGPYQGGMGGLAWDGGKMLFSVIDEAILVESEAAPAFIPVTADDHGAVGRHLDFVHEVLHPAPHAILGIDDEVAEGISDVVPVELARNQGRKLFGLNGCRAGDEVQQVHQSGGEDCVSVHNRQSGCSSVFR